MLFKTRFHEGIRAGDITMTLRAWLKPQATPGKTYKLGASESIAVTAVELIADNPGVSSAILAKQLGRERLRFKADVRKLGIAPGSNGITYCDARAPKM